MLENLLRIVFGELNNSKQPSRQADTIPDEEKKIVEKWKKEDILGKSIKNREDNKTWVLVRASGTEPLLRIYIESDEQEKIYTISDLCSKF